MTTKKKSKADPVEEIVEVEAIETVQPSILEQAAAPVIAQDQALGEELQAKLVKLATGAPLLEILRDHLTAITAALGRGDVRGAALMLNRGLSTLEAYTLEVASLRTAAERLDAASLEVQASHERIIAVLQERASVPPTDTWSDAYRRIDKLEAKFIALETTPFTIEGVS